MLTTQPQKNLEPPVPLTLLLVCASHPRLQAALDELRARGVLVAWSAQADQALQWLSTLTPDLLLVSSAMQSLMTAAAARRTKVLCFDGEPEQLRSNLAPFLPKTSPSEGPQRFGALELDPHSGWVQHQNGPGEALRVHVPATELRLLLCLARQQGRAMSREALLKAAWAANETPQARSVDQVVRRLRPLLAQIGLPDALRSLRGLGYRLDLNLESTGPAPTGQTAQPLV